MSVVARWLVIGVSVSAVALLLAAARWAGASSPPPDAGGVSSPRSAEIPGELPSPPAAHDTPCPAGNCSSATAVTCNSVFSWTNNLGNQWSTYNCLNTSFFSSTPYQEALFTVAITATGLDVGWSVPRHTVNMDIFGAILSQCDNETCLSGGHVVDYDIKQNAILSDAAVATYPLVIDSPNMNGFGDAILACGEHDSGWCWDADVVSTTVPCGVGTLSWTTDSGSDKIIDYGIGYAMDGPEVVAHLVLTSPSFLGMRLTVGSGRIPQYHEYLRFFVLDDACDQRDVLIDSLFVEENTYRQAAGHLEPGDYYIVVDGSHLPQGGLGFDLGIACLANHVNLPVTLTDE